MSKQTSTTRIMYTWLKIRIGRLPIEAKKIRETRIARPRRQLHIHVARALTGRYTVRASEPRGARRAILPYWFSKSWLQCETLLNTDGAKRRTASSTYLEGYFSRHWIGHWGRSHMTSSNFGYFLPPSPLSSSFVII